MKYQEMLKRLAKENNSTPEEVENEMKSAIKAAGYDMEPAMFIALVSAKVKSEIKK